MAQAINRFIWFCLISGPIAVILFFLLALTISVCFARDLGQWEYQSPQERAWWSSLIQPDTLVSCCGTGDGYFADEYHIDDHGNLIAVITDDRDDTPLMRYHVPVGTRFKVPPNKVVDATRQHGNPTGHTIVFLGTMYNADPASRPVLCWVGGGGY